MEFQDIPSADERFMVELEFVSLLSNPKYLNHLASNKYFQDAAFMRFLKYLRYWKNPEYLVYLAFPQCLQILDALIDNPGFRESLLHIPFVEMLNTQMLDHWLAGQQKA